MSTNYIDLLGADVLHWDGSEDEKKIFVEKDAVKKQRQKDIIVGNPYWFLDFWYNLPSSKT